MKNIWKILVLHIIFFSFPIIVHSDDDISNYHDLFYFLTSSENILLGSESNATTITIGVLYKIQNEVDKSALRGLKTAIYNQKLKICKKNGLKFRHNIKFFYFNISNGIQKLLKQTTIEDFHALIYATYTTDCSNLKKISNRAKIPLIVANYEETKMAETNEFVFEIALDKVRSGKLLAQFVTQNYPEEDLILLDSESDARLSFVVGFESRCNEAFQKITKIFYDELEDYCLKKENKLFIIPEYRSSLEKILNNIRNKILIFAYCHNFDYQYANNTILNKINRDHLVQHNTIIYMSYWNSQMKDEYSREFVEAYYNYASLHSNEKNYPICNDAALSYDAMNVFFIAVNTISQSPTKELIKNALYELRGIGGHNGVTGNIFFDSYGDLFWPEMVPNYLSYSKNSLNLSHSETIKYKQYRYIKQDYDFPVGLVAYWNFENLEDPGMDVTGNGLNAVMRGGMPKPVLVSPDNHALKLDGNYEYAKVSYDNRLSPEEYTVLVWYIPLKEKVGEIISKGSFEELYYQIQYRRYPEYRGKKQFPDIIEFFFEGKENDISNRNNWVTSNDGSGTIINTPHMAAMRFEKTFAYGFIEESFSRLKEGSIPEYILSNFSILKMKIYRNKAHFEYDLTQYISKSTYEKYKSEILRCTTLHLLSGYINGILQEKKYVVDEPYDDKTGLWIGKGDTGLFSGFIDEIRIYDRPLIDSEIQEIYETYKNKFSFYPPRDNHKIVYAAIAFILICIACAFFYSIKVKRYFFKNKQLQYILNEKNVSSQPDKSFKPIDNVYIVGNPIKSKDMFFGRNDDFRDIENWIVADGPKVILLRGGRRSGKTSILWQILNGRLKHCGEAVLCDFHKILPRVEEDEDLPYQIGSEIVNNKLFADFYDEYINGKGMWSAKLGQLVRSCVNKLHPRKLLILCDEYESLEDLLHRKVIKNHTLIWAKELLTLPIHFIMTGSKDFNEKLSPIFSPVSQKRDISLLSIEDTKRLIVEPVSEKIEYKDGIEFQIYRLSGGHPFYVQYICSTLINHINSKCKRYYTVNSDIDSVIQFIIRNPTGHIQETWRSMSRVCKCTLAALAFFLDNSEQYAKPIKILKVIKTQRLDISEKDFFESISWLKKETILLDWKNEKIRFKIDLIRFWIKRYFQTGEDIDV